MVHQQKKSEEQTRERDGDEKRQPQNQQDQNKEKASGEVQRRAEQKQNARSDEQKFVWQLFPMINLLLIFSKHDFLHKFVK